MKENLPDRLWISPGEAQRILLEETGLLLTLQHLIEFHNRDHLGAYIDCSFSPGCLTGFQHLAHRIKGADYCKLLSAQEPLTMQEGSEPSLKGPVVVQGMAWVYSQESEEALREEGIWRFDFGDRPRPLHFSRTEIHDLGQRMKLDGTDLDAAPSSQANRQATARVQRLQPRRQQEQPAALNPARPEAG